MSEVESKTSPNFVGVESLQEEEELFVVDVALVQFFAGQMSC